jgi:hypothetical protein
MYSMPYGLIPEYFGRSNTPTSCPVSPVPQALNRKATDIMANAEIEKFLILL